MLVLAAMAAMLQGSVLERQITSSIREIKVDSPTGYLELSDVREQWGSSWNYIHTSAAFTKAANLRNSDPVAAKQLLDSMASIWQRVLPDSDAQGMANVLWACGKLQYADAALWRSTVTAFLQEQQHGTENKGQHVSNVVHGLANIAASSQGQVPGMSQAEVAAAVQQLCSHMRVMAMHPRLEEVIQPQNISNVLWGCAKLRIHPGDAAINSLLQAMSRPAMLEAAAPQEVTNVLWAVSDLRMRCGWQPQLQQRVWERLLAEPQLKLIADQGNPLAVSNAVLAVARLSAPVPASAADAAAPLQPLISGVIGVELGRSCVEVLLHGRVAQQLHCWSAQGVANCMWACAELGVLDAVFFDVAAAAAPSWLNSANSVGVRQLAWACSVLQYKHQHFIAKVLQRSLMLVQQRGRNQLPAYDKLGLAAVVASAVASLDMQQMAGDMSKGLPAHG
jgi:hypothetical protein